jgi:putative endonuclease
MTTHNQRIGKWGEDIAAAYLSDKGYSLLERNARTPYGEIDLVFRRGEETIFVEVKTRTSSRFGPPEIAVTPKKAEHLRNAAMHYAAEHDISHWQIDVLSIEGRPGGKPPKIFHFEAALS